MALNESRAEIYEREKKIPKAKMYLHGIHDGFPIGLGYFAVAFSLGITAKLAGLTAFEGGFASLFTLASAGEYAGFQVILDQAPFITMVIVTLVINARYLLMGCALSQHISPDMPYYHRFFISFGITDEIFSLLISQPGYIIPIYQYGIISIAAPMWSAGTVLGIIFGNILPLRIVSALSVALFGMFIAAVIPAAKVDRKVALAVIASFICSLAAAYLPVISSLSDGTRTIILTIVLASLAAILFPVKDDDEEMEAVANE